MIECCLDGADPLRSESPGPVNADVAVEIPQNAAFAGLSDQRPGNDGPAQLFIHRFTDLRHTAGGGAVGVMMKELAIRPLTERRVLGGAQDEPVPRLIHGVRRHADDLAVAQSRCAAPKPLAQTGFDDVARLPGTRLEDRGRQFEVLHRAAGPLETLLSPPPHAITVSRPASTVRQSDPAVRGEAP